MMPSNSITKTIEFFPYLSLKKYLFYRYFFVLCHKCKLFSDILNYSAFLIIYFHNIDNLDIQGERI